MHILKHYSPPLDPYLDILYRDKHLLVLNKQSGLLSVPGKHEDHKDCVEARAVEAFPTAMTVHRLDMETSGVLVMALDRETHRHIGKQFERRKTSKTYIARLHGTLEKDEGSIDLPLICDWPNRPKQMVDHIAGKEALTHYKVLERERTATRVEFTPITGRSHQLRVHALALGHPILGDNLYGSDEVIAAAPRLQLHALRLTLFHRVRKESMTFEAPLPF